MKLWGFNYKNRNTKAGFHAAPHTQQNGGGEVAKDTNDITRQALAVETRNSRNFFFITFPTKGGADVSGPLIID